MALADGFAEVDAHLEGLYVGRLIAEADVRRMCEKVKEILTAESNVVAVRAPITIVRARTPCALARGRVRVTEQPRVLSAAVLC